MTNIDLICQKIHKTCDIQSFPVDPLQVALSFSSIVHPKDPITHIEGLDIEPDGLLVKNPYQEGHWAILYKNSLVSRERKNFTIAHEFGHYMLHKSLYCDPCFRNTKIIENQANEFASCFLMPKTHFQHKIEGQKLGPEIFQEIAEYYEVSFTAVCLRWIKVCDKRAMIVVGKDGLIEWTSASNRLWQSRKYYRALSGKIRGDFGKKVCLPPLSLAAGGIDWLDFNDCNWKKSYHPKGVWSMHEECWEMTFFIQNSTISLLLYPN